MTTSIATGRSTADLDVSPRSTFTASRFAADLLLLVTYSLAPSAVFVWLVGWSPIALAFAVPGYVFLWSSRRTCPRAASSLNAAAGVLTSLVCVGALIIRGEASLAFALLAIFAMVWLTQLYFRTARGFPYLLIFGAILGAYMAVGLLFSSLSGSVVTMIGDQALGTWLIAGFLFAALVAQIVTDRIVAAVRSRPAHWGSQGWAVADREVAPWVAIVFVVAGSVAFNLMSRFGLADQLGSIASTPRIIECAALVVLFRIGQESGRRRFALFAVAWAFLELLPGFAGSALYEGAAPTLTLFAAWVAISRRVPVALLALVTIGALQLNIVKLEYRVQEGGIRAVQQLSIAEGLTRFVEVSRSVLLTNDPKRVSEAGRRFSYSADMLGYAVEVVPDRFGYPGTQSLSAAPLMLVPRALWPDKPRAAFGNLYGQQLGLLDLSDGATAKNVSLPVEGYLARGGWGLLFVALALGALMSLVGCYRGPSRMTWLVVGATTATVFVGGVESDTTTWLAFIAVSPFVARLAFAAMAGLSRRGSN